ncbi:uncharacterized protein LOC129900200 [Solanum dulcamara]|uniref:uncharacterized protein LOC129900200 n=1 Tax=Solanum dulcamara TaxID=45834 RepID=UPI002484DC5C|nr:uncharacterized protein LOC129900200 [Solanum dulcamara]
MPCIRCRICGTRVAFVEDYVDIDVVWILSLSPCIYFSICLQFVLSTHQMVLELFFSEFVHQTTEPKKHGIQNTLETLPGGIFKRVFNVLLLDKVNYRGITQVQSLFGTTVASTYCGQCRTMLGWKFIAVTQQNMCVREGRYLMKLNKLSLSNGSTNEQNADQDGDANEQEVGANMQIVDQDEDTYKEDVGDIQYNVRNFLMHLICQNAFQGGEANEQVPNEQEVGATEKNVDQEEGGRSNEQVPNEQDVGSNEQNADQDGDANEQDLGANNEQNADQDEDANERDGDCCSCLMQWFNVEVPEGESYHEVKDDMTLTDTYCIECRDRLGWKLIEVPQDCWYEEGQFLMMLDKLSYCNGQLLAHNQAGCANEGNADQEGGANEGNADQVGGTNEGNADQEGGANELVPNDQDGGGNEENVDQDGGDINSFILMIYAFTDAVTRVHTTQHIVLLLHIEEKQLRLNILYVRARELLLDSTMGRLFKLDYDDIFTYDCIHCRICRTRVAFVHNFFPNLNDLVSEGFFSNVFNVEVPEDKRYHQVEGGRTRADTYCVDCRNLLGWKLIAVSEPSRYCREGGFHMRLDELTYWNEVTLLDFLSGGDNEQAPNDQDGGADEQDHDQDVGANEQDHNHNGGANEQNADQDVGTNGQDHDQNGGTNEENADQDGDANEQDHDQNGDANEENADQDVGANEQNVDQDGGDADEQNDDEEDGDANEQDHNHNGGANEENTDQDVGTNEQNVDQDGGDANEQNDDEEDGDANEQDHDHNVGANEENADQDVGANEENA